MAFVSCIILCPSNLAWGMVQRDRLELRQSEHAARPKDTNSGWQKSAQHLSASNSPGSELGELHTFLSSSSSHPLSLSISICSLTCCCWYFLSFVCCICHLCFCLLFLLHPFSSLLLLFCPYWGTAYPNGGTSSECKMWQGGRQGERGVGSVELFYGTSSDVCCHRN